MDKKMKNFVDRLNFGQSYLLLGQQYLAETITNSYYERVAERLGTDKRTVIYI